MTEPLPRLDAALATGPELQSRKSLHAPTAGMLSLPERAVQFGTGGLLRGLVDAIIDDANRAGTFGGRVVAIGSTGSGRDRALNDQDGLFTLQVEGRDNGAAVRERRIIASLSRAISATDDWSEVLGCARNPSLEVVFSNTTEVGIVLDEQDAAHEPPSVPRSFPGKLTRFLHERAETFAYSHDKGVAVVPCELIERNGDVLRDIVLQLADRWSLGPRFHRWVSDSVVFCNTLVDRIVSGTPSPHDAQSIMRELQYRDDMLTVTEPYRLLAIEPRGSADGRARLRFATGDHGAIVVDDVTPYRDRKVRLLNGGHTVIVSLALLAGCETVLDAMTHPHVGRFVRRVVLEELLPTVNVPGATTYAHEVLERFANPFLKHKLRDITLHCGMKMRVRVIPGVVSYMERTGRVPSGIALGFAAYLAYARERHEQTDDVGAQIRERWRSDGADVRSFVQSVCRDVGLWGVNLDAASGFVDAVTGHLTRVRRDGAVAAIVAHTDAAHLSPPPPPSPAIVSR